MTLAVLLMAWTAGPLGAQVVIPGASGQVGPTPDPDDVVVGATFESIRGLAGEILLGGLTVFGGAAPPPPEFQFHLDDLHGPPDPQMALLVPATFDEVFDQAPASDRRRNQAGDGDFVALSFARDGSLPDTMTLDLLGFDETGAVLSSTSLEDLDTFGFPDPAFSETGVVVDRQGRATLVFTEFDAGAPTVRGQRFDLDTGAPLDGGFEIGPAAKGDADAALLDPPGAEVAVAMLDFASGEIVGRTIDFSGGVPVVGAEFPISSTPAPFGNINPAIAGDPATGAFVVAWEHVTADVGDPVGVRARRFDAAGNPVGPDFQVETTTANAQGQPVVAFGPNGEFVIAWAGDGEVLPDDGLDVFFQVYDADGAPIGGEVRANATKLEEQDRPAVRFLPEPDAQGRPQFAVIWRDVSDPSGTGANGTGTSYRCFSIAPEEIFSDGFESGDVSSWSGSVP